MVERDGTPTPRSCLPGPGASSYDDAPVSLADRHGAEHLRTPPEEFQPPHEVEFEELSERNAKMHRTITRMTAEHTRLHCRLAELEEKAELLEMVPPFLREASELNFRKSQDYGTEGDLSKRKYHPFGAVSYLHMLHLKLERLTSVLGKGENPNFESARDSLVDLVNYATFFGAYMDEEEAKQADDTLAEWADAEETLP